MRSSVRLVLPFLFLLLPIVLLASRGRGVVGVEPGRSATIPIGARGGHPGEEIEGIIQTLDAAGGSLTIADARLGTVAVTIDDSTVIRKGETPWTAAQLAVGMRVHIKASIGADGSYTAAEIIVQDDGSDDGGETEVAGTVLSIDPAAMTFTIDTGDANVTVATDAATEWHGHDLGGLADLHLGDSVEVEGTTQTDGSVLARSVAVED